MPSPDPRMDRGIYILQNVVGSCTEATVRYTLTTDDGLHLPSGPVPLTEGYYRIDAVFDHDAITMWALNATGGDRHLELRVIDVPPFVEVAANPITCNLNRGADSHGRVIIRMDFDVVL